ncbi:MAG: hypothetical protein HQL09_04200 [Nitrospirae bacterium]|nr:hypothetical protein [Nitrospirota bacterium]
MRNSANLLNDTDTVTLNRDMDAIARNHSQRDLNRDFDSYLTFLEESAAAFGFNPVKRNKPLEVAGNAPLL